MLSLKQQVLAMTFTSGVFLWQGDPSFVLAQSCGSWNFTTNIGPSVRTYHAMASYPGSIVLFGGWCHNANNYMNDTWSYSEATNTWTQLFPGTLPTARSLHALTGDWALGGYVLFGGLTAPPQIALNDTWEFVGGNWTQVTINGPIPTGRYRHAMTYDPIRDVTILFGGSDQNFNLLGDTWEYKNGVWTQGPSGPSARYQHAMAFDVSRGVAVLFGGVSAVNGINDETWEYDGTSWVQCFPDCAPTARQEHAMANGNQQCSSVTLFGGRDLSPADWRHDTWEWDGINWNPVASGAPMPSFGHALANDYTSGVTVLHGGNSLGNCNDDTWEWSCGAGSSQVQTYVSGIADGFVSPADPASPSPNLQCAYPNSQWKNFDPKTSDRYVGATFPGLPAGIYRAKLEVRMRPGYSSCSANDSLNLGFNSTCTADVPWTMMMASIPNGPGVWNPGQSPTTFTLELDNLPPDADSTTNVLCRLAEERFLDVFVQDDTAVDYIRLKVWYCP